MFHCRLHNRQSSHSPWTRMDGDKAPVFQCLQSPAVTRREDVIKRDSCYNLIGLAHERGPTRPRSHDPQLMLMCRVFQYTSNVTLHSLYSLDSEHKHSQHRIHRRSFLLSDSVGFVNDCGCLVVGVKTYSYLFLCHCKYLSPASLSFIFMACQ